MPINTHLRICGVLNFRLFGKLFRVTQYLLKSMQVFVGPLWPVLSDFVQILYSIFLKLYFLDFVVFSLDLLKFLYFRAILADLPT